MNNDIIKVLKIVAVMAPITLACLSLSKNNLNKKERHKQFLMPIISLIILIIGVVQIDRIVALGLNIVHLLDSLFIYLQKYPQLISVTNKIEAAITQNIVKVSIYVANLLIITIYAAVKKIILMFMRRLFKGEGFVFENTGGLFYEYNEDMNVFCLKDRYTDTRDWYKYAYYSAMLILLALFGVSQFTKNPEFFPVPFYPVFGIIILCEVFQFLNGYNAKEYFGEVKGEGIDGDLISNYHLLRDTYKKVISDRIMFDKTYTNLQDTEDYPNVVVNQYLNSQEFTDKVVARALERHLRQDGTIDSNLAMAAANLMKGKCVLFNIPFYMDLSPYIFLPINHTLLNGKKVMFIAGHQESIDSLADWINEEVDNTCGVPGYWKVGGLTATSSNLDIGILNILDIYDMDIYNRNIKFLNEVDFVMIIEPSALLSTSQIGLDIYLNECNRYTRTTYCACDRNVDGLVDSLSHVIKESILEVNAMSVDRNVATVMLVEADGDYLHHRIISGVSRYLGVGTTLAMIAVKNQVPLAHWFSGRKFPIGEMSWLVEQYYEPLCKYSQMIVNQTSIDRAFKFHTSMWDGEKTENGLYILEDEYNNLFEMYKYFSTRSTKEAFLHIISSDYMLREYMCDNSLIFTNDLKAIPAIAPDFAKTERNLIIKLAVMMGENPVAESVIAEELTRHAIKYEGTVGDELEQLIKRHIDTEDYIDLLCVEFNKDYTEDIFGETKVYYKLYNKSFIDRNMQMLTNTYYILEDEDKSKHMLGSTLYGNIYQKHLPSQYMTYDGKYYEIKSVDNQGVIVRRSAEHVFERIYYRQDRIYNVNNVVPFESTGNIVKIGGITLLSASAEIEVATSGYYQMKKYGDYANAKYVSVNNIPNRNYINKDILEIKIDDISADVRVSIALMLNELFYTTFPLEYHYICALTDGLNANMDVKLSYDCEIDGTTDSIYIIEDSQMDLGLISATRKNIFRFLEIIEDFIKWKLEKTEPEETPAGEETEEDIIEEPVEEKKKCFLMRFFAWIKRKFKGDDSTDEEQDKITSAPKYQQYEFAEFLNFGYEKMPDFINLSDIYETLKKEQLENSYIYQARNKIDLATIIQQEYNPNLPGVYYCDFCGLELTGVTYTHLKDGRMRCMKCSATAVSTLEHFNEILKKTKANMEEYYEIKLKDDVSIRLANAKQIARKTGEKFVATPGFDARVLGFAQQRGNNYSLWVENGAPELSTIRVIAHEYTHIWQYTHWDRRAITRKYGRRKRKQIYEGMAVWSAIQYLVSIGQIGYAKRVEITTLQRDDEYGKGLKLFLGMYPIVYDSSVLVSTPFENKGTVPIITE